MREKEVIPHWKNVFPTHSCKMKDIVLTIFAIFLHKYLASMKIVEFGVKEEAKENVTISELSFVPTTEDDGKSITCRAENPNVTGLFLETTWKINVVYPPIVTLCLGSTLNADDIKEGDDVYFECHVTANPQWRRLTWLHDVSRIN
ncbi:hypothetical protein JTB14_027745 [Gonioctena quinquepunctata]|nr:hypothetical protein JTB14_027745 [Gonioctena quinquepunctata]